MKIVSEIRKRGENVKLISFETFIEDNKLYGKGVWRVIETDSMVNDYILPKIRLGIRSDSLNLSSQEYHMGISDYLKTTEIFETTIMDSGMENEFNLIHTNAKEYGVDDDVTFLVKPVKEK